VDTDILSLRDGAHFKIYFYGWLSLEVGTVWSPGWHPRLANSLVTRQG